MILTRVSLVRGLTCKADHRRRMWATCVLSVCIGITSAAPAQEVMTLLAAGQPEQLSATLEDEGEEAHAEEEHTSLTDTIARLVNFAILVGALVMLLKSPIAEYLANRGAQVRSDLEHARAMNAAAAKQLEDIDDKLRELPAEIDALKARGQGEIDAEEVRLQQVTAAERERVLEQTRREIDLQLRTAKRDLVQHAATLAVDVATQRVKETLTAADHVRLVDRYVEQVRAE